MKGVNQEELIPATILAYSLVMALLNELDEAGRQRVAKQALQYFPPEPDERNGTPVNNRIWRVARERLQKIVGT